MNVLRIVQGDAGEVEIVIFAASTGAARRLMIDANYALVALDDLAAPADTGKAAGTAGAPGGQEPDPGANVSQDGKTTIDPAASSPAASTDAGSAGTTPAAATPAAIALDNREVNSVAGNTTYQPCISR